MARIGHQRSSDALGALGLLVAVLLVEFWPYVQTPAQQVQLDEDTALRRVLRRREHPCYCGTGTSSSRLRGSAAACRALRSAGASATIFDFEVASAARDAFKQSCLDFCSSASSNEQGILTRTDLLQEDDAVSRFLLRVVHGNAPNTLDTSPSYTAWREELDALSQVVAAQTAWELVYPASASYGTLILERSLPGNLEIRLLELASKTAKKEKLAEAAVEYAKACSSSGILRVEVLRSVASPWKFLILEVFESKAAEDSNVISEHYMRFEDVVAETMAMDPNLKSYKNLFPSVPAAWRRT